VILHILAVFKVRKNILFKAFASTLSWQVVLFSVLFIGVYTGCGRNSELIINKNNILLKVIDTNFSTAQFTMVLNIFLHSFTLCVQCLLGGLHPLHTSYEAAHNGLKCFFWKFVRCANWGLLTRWLFTRDRAFFTPLPYPSMDCIWIWGFLLIPFTAKSALSLIDPFWINSSTTHTRSLTPQCSMFTKSEGHCLCSNTCTPRYPSGEARN
jgi:hypothetical protein